MIVDKNITVKIYSKNINYYKKLGYDVKNNDIIEIPVEELSKGSHIFVNIVCDICGKEKSMRYHRYTRNIERQGYYTCCPKCGNQKRIETNLKKYNVKFSALGVDIKTKREETNVNKYGVSNVFMSDIFKEKIRETCFEKYGYFYPMQNENIKNKSLKNRKNTLILDTSLYHSYKLKIRNLTKQNKKFLFENWDGFDFYDGEFIKDNFLLDSNSPEYPTIDHKIPTTYGFLNNITPEEMCHLDNLCITKRRINSTKNNKLNFSI